MEEDPNNTERKRNIWAPWRMEYIRSLGEEKPDECFFCHNRQNENQDEKNLVLWRGRRCFAMLNRFPYTGGHSLVAPLDHLDSLDALDSATMLEMMEMVRDLRKLLTETIHAEGFNVGINIGRCAGAGLPGHLHIHIVPRWSGDTNFMPVFGQVHVVPQLLADLYVQLRQAGDRLGLPELSS